MIRVFFFILVVAAISASAIWMIENNGSLEIVWLGYLIKTDILTSLVIVIALYAILAVLFGILSKIFSLNLKQIFSPNKLKKLTKLLQKDEQSFDAIFKILQRLEDGEYKEALKDHKQLTKTSQHQDLNDFLLAKIHYCLGDYKKSQDIAANIEDLESQLLIVASELEIALKKKNKIKIAELAADIIAKSPMDSQNKALKKAVHIKIEELAELGEYKEAKELLDERKILSQDPDLLPAFVRIHHSLSQEAFDKKSFIAAIRYANKTLAFDADYIPAYEIKIRSWLALGLVTKARFEIKKQFKKYKDEIFVTLFDESHKGQSDEKRQKAVQQFIGKTNKMMNFSNKSSKTKDEKKRGE